MLKISQQNIEEKGEGGDIQAFLRELIMNELGVPVQKAQEISDKFANQIRSSQWVSLSNGLTFERKFDPSSRKRVGRDEVSPPEWSDIAPNAGYGGGRI